MLLLEIHVINNISREEIKFQQTISGLVISPDYNLMANYQKLKTAFSKPYTKILSFFMGILYLYIMISLKIINVRSLIFFYGAITLIVTVYYAIRLYCKYLFYIYFLKKISEQNISEENYNRIFPNRTKWLVDVANFLSKFKYYFSILGCMYTFEYLFTMDKDFLIFKENIIKISTPNNYMFITSWIIIALFIGAGYFAYNELIKYYLIKIIKNMKS